LTHRRAFLDTNILVYAFAESGTRTPIAANLLADGGVVSVQILNEFAAVMRRKFKVELSLIARFIEKTLKVCPGPLPLTMETHRAGMRLCGRYGFSVYDGTMIASALEAGCGVLYTEDLQHGQVIDGLRIENPFVQK
jgi:predicted nucleic acid-binding protein